MPIGVVQNEPGAGEAAMPSILVVDDDPNIRRLIIAALKRDGYAFMQAANGQEALDSMRTEHPDVVVLDLMMPLVSGWEVLEERMKDARLSRIPVIVVSATRGPEIASVVDRGICAFLPKPFDIDALKSLVRTCISAADRGHRGLDPLDREERRP
jgi:CheY-like chemotaxis protein